MGSPKIVGTSWGVRSYGYEYIEANWPPPCRFRDLTQIMEKQMENMKWKVGHTLVYNRDDALQQLAVAFWKPV